MCAATAKFYELSPNKIGGVVRGIDLKRAVSDACREQIVRDVREQRLLVFRDQVAIQTGFFYTKLWFKNWLQNIQRTLHST